jgi:DNA primase
MSENIFSFLRNKIEIEKVVSDYVLLKPAGNYLKGLSPFKKEKTPSFTVSPSKKIFYCFSTHIGGDIIDFIKNVENCSKIEAAMILIKKYNIEIPKEFLNTTTNKKNDIEKYYNICNFFKNWTIKNLANSKDAKKYIINRGIDKEQIDTFNIGYCPSSRTNINTFLNEAYANGIIIEDLIKAGIIFEQKNTSFSNKKNHLFQFEERIIFPIFDQNNNIFGFSGRIFNENDLRPKYINSTNSVHFSKGEILYGLNIARKKIIEEKHVFIVEGYFDVIAMHKCGFKNTVATMGTACTNEQLNLVSKITENITVIYDGDEAGQNAIMRLIKMCWTNFIDINVVSINENDDPATLMQKNILSESIIKNKQPGSIYFINKKKNEFIDGGIKEKSIALEEIIDCLSKIIDPYKKIVLSEKISNEIKIPLNFLLKDQNNKKNPEIKKKIISENKDSEKIWFFFTIYCIVLYDKNKEEIEIILNFINENASNFEKKIIETYKDHIKKTENYNYLTFFDIIEESLKKKIFSEILNFDFSISHVRILYRELQKKVFKKKALHENLLRLSSIDKKIAN